MTVYWPFMVMFIPPLSSLKPPPSCYVFSVVLHRIANDQESHFSLSFSGRFPSGPSPSSKSVIVRTRPLSLSLLPSSNGTIRAHTLAGDSQSLVDLPNFIFYQLFPMMLLAKVENKTRLSCSWSSHWEPVGVWRASTLYLILAGSLSDFVSKTRSKGNLYSGGFERI